jgi:hypothetical protein
MTFVPRQDTLTRDGKSAMKQNRMCSTDESLDSLNGRELQEVCAHESVASQLIVRGRNDTLQCHR